MKIIKKKIAGKRNDIFRIIPLGDIHLGARACEEEKLKKVIQDIEKDEFTYWIGMGDYCDLINLKDPRFNYASLAPWIHVENLGDIIQVQKEKFLDYIKPIAHKCLALMEGNHETAVKRHTERDIYREIVSGVKQLGNIPAEEPLALGYYGWLQIFFNDSKKTVSSTNINIHHGFTGGRLAGAKALNMQRWLWTHNADVVIFGHSHNTGTQVEAVESISTYGNVQYNHRIGTYSGTFLSTTNKGGATYSEVKGYMPTPVTYVEIFIKPWERDASGRINVQTHTGG